MGYISGCVVGSTRVKLFWVLVSTLCRATSVEVPALGDVLVVRGVVGVSAMRRSKTRQKNKQVEDPCKFLYPPVVVDPRVP